MPIDEFIEFITARFAHAGKRIEHSIASEIVAFTDAYPYYTQKLALIYYEALESGDSSIENAKLELIKSESSDCENIYVGLAANQKKLLKAVAINPTPNLYSSDYLRNNHLGAASSVKVAAEKLLKLDLIEKRDGIWKTVDPIFGKYLSMRV